jgi:SAM-dependent methyltransferase
MNEHGAAALDAADARLRRFLPREGRFPSWMAPLDKPRWLKAAQAHHMRPGDPVLGLAFEGQAWALPWWVMKNHHVSNLDLAGRPVVVTLCEVCTSAGAFDPRIDGRRHHFRLAGIYNGTIMPLDDESGSCWTGFTGQCVSGTLEGRSIARLPLWQAMWGEWCEMHPHTLVADGAGEPRGGHGEGQSPGSPVVGTGMRPQLAHVDLRMAHYHLVLGVLAANEARCYPLLALPGPVLNDRLGGEDIVIFSQPGTWVALAFSRAVDGRSLTFRSIDGAILDDQTGSRWSLAGIASEGPLTGRALQFVHSGIEEFFIWAAFFPATSIYGPAASAPSERHWSVDLVPEAVHRGIHTWWPAGASVLHLPCGEGMVAAWMAERGLQVLALDESEAAISRARASFRGVPRLDYRVADLRRPLALEQKFDGIADTGLFGGLADSEASIYAESLARAARPGARFLLLIPAAESEHGAVLGRVRQFFEPAFKVIGLSSLPLWRAATDDMAPAATFRLVRS